MADEKRRLDYLVRALWWFSSSVGGFGIFFFSFILTETLGNIPATRPAKPHTRSGPTARIPGRFGECCLHAQLRFPVHLHISALNCFN